MNLSHPLQLIAHPLDGQVLEVLSGADAAFTAPEVRALVGEHSPRGVRLALERLHRQGIVTAQPAGRVRLYSLNRDHLAAPQVVGLSHLRYELIRRLRSAFASWDLEPAAAYLFGSTARGDSSPGSDIDICVIRGRNVDDPDQPEWRALIETITRDVNMWTGNDVRVLELGEDEVRGRIGHDPLLASIRDEGIQLAGDDDPLRDTVVQAEQKG